MFSNEERRKMIESQQIKKPIFIIALPRTGTTFLYNLLGCDPAARLPLHSDMLPGNVTPPIKRADVEEHKKRLALYSLLLKSAESIIENLNETYCASHAKYEYEEDFRCLHFIGLFNLITLFLPTHFDEDETNAAGESLSVCALLRQRCMRLDGKGRCCILVGLKRADHLK
jgi:hypothetical protein